MSSAGRDVIRATPVELVAITRFVNHQQDAGRRDQVAKPFTHLVLQQLPKKPRSVPPSRSTKKASV
jgi:hypothetical protein